MTGWPFATCLTFGPYGAFACGQFSEDHALEAWERMTTGGLGFHPKRALILYVGELAYRASQTKYVREGAVVTR